jgi:hypothetical protein
MARRRSGIPALTLMILKREAGSIPERGADDKLYNTCTVYSPAGCAHRDFHSPTTNCY